MIIQELHIKNFGRFSEKILKLSPGMNLITGKNESGKSTAAQFIRAMLYGMKRGRGRGAAKDAFHRYAPWSHLCPEGSMRFSCQGKNFLLKRIFPEGEELFCTDDGEQLDVTQGDLLMLMGGMREGLYQNTIYAGMGELIPGNDLTEYLSSYLLNLESTQEEQADVQAALKRLKELRKEADTEFRMQYRLRQERLDRLRNRMEELEKEIRKIKSRQETLQEEYPETEDQKKTAAAKKGFKRFVTAAVCGVLAIVFAGIDHFIPAVMMALAGCVILAEAFWRDRSEEHRRNAVSEERRSLEYRLRKEHMEEACQDTVREYRNCEEAYREQLMPGEEERYWQKRTTACEEAACRIKAASEQLAKNWAVQLEEDASEILRKITNGRYFGLKIGERMAVTVTDGSRICQPDQLSVGTREQIWVSIRMAAAMLLSEEAMPLVFDDAFLGWDEERLKNMLLWLSSCGRQVLVFTGQDREERILCREMCSYSKIILDE